MQATHFIMTNATYDKNGVGFGVMCNGKWFMGPLDAMTQHYVDSGATFLEACALANKSPYLLS